VVKKNGKKRVWVPRNISSVAHPTRQAIIKCLEKGPRTTVELEKELEESRYNLYHHLKTLKDQCFIKEQIVGRMKVYELETGRKEARELGADVESLSRVQQAITVQSAAGAGGADNIGKQIRLEVKGSLLNRILGNLGEKKVAGKKKYEIVITESPSKKKKARKK